MPVPRPRRNDERVKYVIVRRAGVEEEVELEDVGGFFGPSPTVNQLLSGSKARRQAQPSETDYDSDDDDDYDDDYLPSSRPTESILLATTPTSKQPTALPENDPTQTVLETVTQSASSSSTAAAASKGGGGGISSTTQHLLIAAGSVGATIIIVMILLAMHTMRRRGLTLSEAFQLGKYHITRRGPPPPPPKKAGGWDKQAYNGNYGSMRTTITEPQRAMSINRSGSTSSQRPLMALQRNESFRTIADTKTPQENAPQTFLLDAPPKRNKSHRRNGSGETTSSAALPLQKTRRSASTHNTRSMVESELKYPEPVEQPLSPLPPPPTFKQFLFNRPSISGRPGMGGPMVSRFSWTNSQAPQTPHDPRRDTNTHTIGRDSFMTQRSSLPRFRTVDSWVNQQANRIEEQKLKEQFRLTGTSTVYSGDDVGETIPEVPTLPKNVGELRDAAAPPTISVIEAPKAPVVSPPPLGGGLPGKNIKHERQDTHTTVETAPIFRQHPGTEVRFSTHSVVPSEILDMGREPNVLS